MVNGVNYGTYGNYSNYGNYGSYGGSGLGVDNTYMAKWEPIYNTKPTQPENTEPPKKKKKKLGFWGKLKNAVKGVGKFFKGLVCDENGKFSLGKTLKTVACGLVIGAASVLIPGAGTVIACAALGMAAKNVVKAGVQIANAETYEEQEQAWQNLGSGMTEGALAYAGFRATGGLGAVKNVAKGVKSSAGDIAAAYKAGGSRALAAEMKYQGNQAWQGAKSTYHSTIDGTKANWRAILNKDTKFQNTMNAYDAKIAQAQRSGNTALEASLKAEQAAYKAGFEKVATNTNYSKANKAVQRYEAQMKSAQEAYRANRTSANEAAYNAAKAKYEAASRTLETRVNNGEFRVTDSARMSRMSAKTKASRDYMTSARESLGNAKRAYEANPSDPALQSAYQSAQTAYNNAFKAYNNALANETAAIGRASKRFYFQETAVQGAKTPAAKWLTLSQMGNSPVYPEYEYYYEEYPQYQQMQYAPLYI